MERRTPAHGHPAEPPPSDQRAAEREARLAAALRANLRRRKAQSRARQDTTANDPRPEPSAGADGSGRT